MPEGRLDQRPHYVNIDLLEEYGNQRHRKKWPAPQAFALVKLALPT